jgi:DNA-binding NarL/FixJ family response regulator
MTKPTVYIVVEDGLVQEVYVHALFGANADVVICDMDTTEAEEREANEKLMKELPDFAHKVY